MQVRKCPRTAEKSARGRLLDRRSLWGVFFSGNGTPATGLVSSNRGSDALPMKSRLREADDARLEQIEFPASVHLAFDQLQLADLPFGLAVGPRRRDCRRHGGLILRDPVGESGNEAA